MDKLDPITPGELLLEEFLIPMGISQYRLAKEIGVPPQRIVHAVHARRTACRRTATLRGEDRPPSIGIPGASVSPRTGGAP